MLAEPIIPEIMLAYLAQACLVLYTARCIQTYLLWE